MFGERTEERGISADAWPGADQCGPWWEQTDLPCARGTFNSRSAVVQIASVKRERVKHTGAAEHVVKKRCVM